MVIKEKEDKGNVIYISPKCPVKKRVYVLINWFFLHTLSFLVAFYFIHNGIIKGKVGYIAFGLFWIGSALLMGFYICQQTMFEHFRIFSKGIEERCHHFQPFSECHKFRDGLEFVEWKAIAGFSAFHPKKSHAVVVHFNIFDKRGIRKWFWDYRHSGDAGKKVINNLIKELKEHDINEIPHVCPTCKKRAVVVMEICPHCKTKRF